MWKCKIKRGIVDLHFVLLQELCALYISFYMKGIFFFVLNKNNCLSEFVSVKYLNNQRDKTI